LKFNFDHEFNSVRKMVYALKNSFMRTVFYPSFQPGASLLRHFAPGYYMPPFQG